MRVFINIYKKGMNYSSQFYFNAILNYFLTSGNATLAPVTKMPRIEATPPRIAPTPS